MTLQLTVIRAEKLPVADIGGTSDPYVEVFTMGSIKYYMGKTNTVKKNLNPVWKWTVNFPAIRGIRIRFDIYDEDKMSTNQLLSICEFDPRKCPFNKEVRIPCTNIVTKQGKDAAIFVNVSVAPINPQIGPTPINAPIYITVDSIPTSTPSSVSPDSLYSPHGAVGPYRLPYDLYLVAVNESTKSFEVLGPQNRRIPGAWHSGCRPCMSCNSLSEVIRMDTGIMKGAGFNQMIIVISTHDYTPLSQYFNSAFVKIWVSAEPAMKYERGLKYDLSRQNTVDLKLFKEIPIKPESTSNIFAVGGFVYQKDALNINSATLQYPDAQGQTAQTAYEMAHEIATVYCGRKTSFVAQDSFPLYETRSLSHLMSLTAHGADSDIAQIVTAGTINTRSHSIVARTFNRDGRLLESCNSSASKAHSDALTYNGGKITVKLTEVPEEVTHIYFTVEGSKQLSEEKPRQVIGKSIFTKGKDKAAQSAVTDPYLQLTIDEKCCAVSMPMSQTKNASTILWFVLARDAFGGWGLFNATKTTAATDPQLIQQEFISLYLAFVA